jgi:uncharacterized protein YdaU (DUF1376 family)
MEGPSVNYWPRWINAISNATATLSLVQMGAYDRLLDHAYKTEQPLPSDLDECCRIVRASTKAEREAVLSVLARFWELTPAGYSQARVTQEIALALPKIEAARTNGKAGGRPRGTQKKPSGFPPGTQKEPKAKAPQSSSSLRSELHPPLPSGVSPPPDGVSRQVWDDWLALRKAKKAPVTSTVLESAIAESAKAGVTLEEFLRIWCAKGYQGMQADWIKPHERPSTPKSEPEWRTEQREVNVAFLGPAARRSSSTNTIDAEAHDGDAKLLA